VEERAYFINPFHEVPCTAHFPFHLSVKDFPFPPVSAMSLAPFVQKTPIPRWRLPSLFGGFEETFSDKTFPPPFFFSLLKATFFLLSPPLDDKGFFPSFYAPMFPLLPRAVSPPSRRSYYFFLPFFPVADGIPPTQLLFSFLAGLFPGSDFLFGFFFIFFRSPRYSFVYDIRSSFFFFSRRSVTAVLYMFWNTGKFFFPFFSSFPLFFSEISPPSLACFLSPLPFSTFPRLPLDAFSSFFSHRRPVHVPPPLPPLLGPFSRVTGFFRPIVCQTVGSLPAPFPSSG